MPDENLVILEFKYLQNKKWWKQAVKSARINKNYRTYYFHFTQITDKNSIFLQKLAIFNICHVFTSIHEPLWMQIFVFLQPMWLQERSSLSASRKFQPQGGSKQEKHIKKHEILAFKPLLEEIWLKNLSSRKIFQSLTSNLWNKKKIYCRSLPKWSEIELYSPPMV